MIITQSKPLLGKTILVTRAQTSELVTRTQTSELVTCGLGADLSLEDRLSALGAEVILLPTITIGDPPDWHLFDEAARQISSFDWVIFTSANSVLQTKKRLAFLGKDLSQNPSLKVAAIGKGTADKIKSLGWSVHLIPADFQAEGLLATLTVDSVKGLRFWFPRALKARELLADKLQSKKAVVVLTPVYQNRLPLENKDRLISLLQKKTLDWITFTSSSTVTNFFILLEGQSFLASLPKLASIGRITSDTITCHQQKATVTAHPQNFEGLCQAILDWELQ